MHKLLKATLTAAVGLAVAGTTVAAPRLSRAGQQGRTLDAGHLTPAPKSAVKEGAVATTVKKHAVRNLARSLRGTAAPQNAPAKIRLGAGAEGKTVYGYMIMGNDWTETNSPYGIYSLSLAGSPAASRVAEAENTISAAWLADGKYYCYRIVDFYGIALGTTVDTYNATTFEHLSHEIPDLKYQLPADPKQNPADGKIYSVVRNSSNVNRWGTIDQYTYEFQPIADVDWVLTGFVIKDGTGYGVTPSGSLLRIDLATGSAANIGSTGLQGTYLSSAWLDDESGRMYYINVNEVESALYSVDLTTAAAEKVYNFSNGEEILGLYAPRQMAAGTPAAPSAVSIALDGESLNYTVSITAPSVTVGGETLAAEGLTYKLTAGNGDFTGSIAPGETVTVACTAAQAGYVSARAVLLNAAGESDGAGTKAYVGPDQLTAVKNVLLTDDNAGKFTLSWQPVQMVHGGWLDTAQLSYTVTFLDGSTVAEGLTEPRLEIPYEAPAGIEVYQYGVHAVYKGVAYQEVLSNMITKGATEPPFECLFNEEADLAQFNIIDANNDNKKWKFDPKGDGCARMTYHSKNVMDDWMVLPGMSLRAGNVYRFSMDAFCGGAQYPERFEVRMGRVCSPDSMNVTVIEPTVVNTTQAVNHSASIVVPQDGVYFIGIHGISDPDNYYLYVDNVRLSAAVPANTPAAVSNLTVTPDVNGGLTAAVSFDVPAVNIVGQPLTALTKAVVTNGDSEVVATVENPTPGQTVTVTDTNARSGVNSYSVVVVNEAGTSEAVAASAFVGHTVPGAVTGVTAVESAEGQVTLSWDAVTKDANGLNLGEGSVKYAVYIFDGQNRTEVVKDLDQTTYTYQAVPAGQQQFIQWAVFPETVIGEGAGGFSNMLALGMPYQTPLHESFAEQTLTYNWMLATPDPDHVMDVALATDQTVTGVRAQDGDNGYFLLSGTYVGDAAELVSGKISIPEEGQTVFSFYAYGMSLETGNDITATVYCDGTATVLGTAKPLADQEWVRYSYDLQAFAGKTVMLSISCTVSAQKLAMFDNVFVGTPRQHDLVLTRSEAPASVDAGAEITVKATVENRGVQTAAGYTVEFYMNGALLSTVAGTELAPMAKTTFECAVPTNAMTPDNLEFFAVVNYAADEDTDNNTGVTVTTAVAKSDMPVPATLTATVADNAVQLNWDACTNIDGLPETVTEGFESGTPWAKEFAGWTIVDRDGSPVGGVNEADLPGIVPGETCMGFFVWDTTDNLGWVSAHSGNRLMATLFRDDYGTIDDWLISPALSGKAQTVSFWACSYDNAYPEQLEVYYTTGESVNPDDYVKLESFGTKTLSSWDWAEFKFDLPEGATHFAIRSCATESFLLLLDDVTFEIAGASAQLLGYNVYCNGLKVNAEPVAENAYLHTPEADVEHVYNVTAVYDKGESRPSNEARILVNGLDNLTDALKVVALHGEIAVSGANGADVTVFAADGRKLARRSGVDAARIKVQPGVYVVTVGPRSIKIAVK